MAIIRKLISFAVSVQKKKGSGSKSQNAGREFHLISIAKIRHFGGTLSVFVRFSQILSV